MRGVAQRLRKLAREREVNWTAQGFWIRQGYKVEAGNTSRGAGLGGAGGAGLENKAHFMHTITSRVPVQHPSEHSSR